MNFAISANFVAVNNIFAKFKVHSMVEWQTQAKYYNVCPHAGVYIYIYIFIFVTLQCVATILEPNHKKSARDQAMGWHQGMKVW